MSGLPPGLKNTDVPVGVIPGLEVPVQKHRAREEILAANIGKALMSQIVAAGAVVEIADDYL